MFASQNVRKIKQLSSIVLTSLLPYARSISHHNTIVIVHKHNKCEKLFILDNDTTLYIYIIQHIHILVISHYYIRIHQNKFHPNHFNKRK